MSDKHASRISVPLLEIEIRALAEAGPIGRNLAAQLRVLDRIPGFRAPNQEAGWQNWPESK